MKITMFGHKQVPSRSGGVEVAATELSVRMAAMGHDVTCYNRGGRNGAYRDVRLRAIPSPGSKGIGAVTSGFSAAVCAALSNAEVVHIHAEGPAFFCGIPKLFGKRVVVTVHGLDWQREKWKGSFGSRFIHAGEAMAVRFADDIIVLSRNVRDYFRDTYGRETVYIPNGICLPEGAEASLCTRLGLEQDGFLLFLGRLVPEKGIHYLLETFRTVKTGKKLVIAGASSDTDDYVSRLKEMAKGDPRVIFTGAVEGKYLRELYGKAWVYVLPSELEGMPLTLLEALHCGCCCLVSDIPECTEVTGNCAVMVPKGNVSALAEALQRLCDDPALVARYREKARARALPDWETVTEMTLKVYEGGNPG